MTTKRTCPQCNGPKDFYAKACRGCSPKPKGWAGIKGKNHPTWKGGRYIDQDGYQRTYSPDHPWPRKGGYVYEQVRLMELHLGRKLDPATESVHHIDYDRLNNAMANLTLIARGAHSSHHRKLDIHLRQRDEKGRFA